MKDKTKNSIKSICSCVVSIGVSVFCGNVFGTIVTKTGMGLVDAIVSGIGANAVTIMVTEKAVETNVKLLDEVLTTVDEAQKEAEAEIKAEEVNANGNIAVSE